jgi:hypothetical protein
MHDTRGTVTNAFSNYSTTPLPAYRRPAHNQTDFAFPTDRPRPWTLSRHTSYHTREELNISIQYTPGPPSIAQASSSSTSRVFVCQSLLLLRCVVSMYSSWVTRGGRCTSALRHPLLPLNLIGRHPSPDTATGNTPRFRHNSSFSTLRGYLPVMSLRKPRRPHTAFHCHKSLCALLVFSRGGHHGQT